MADSAQAIASQSIRYRDTVVQIETDSLDGVEYLFFDNIQQRFPLVTSLSCDNVQLTFVRDGNGNRLEPLRIQARKDKIIDALDPEEHYNDKFNIRLDHLSESINEMQKTIGLIQTDVKTSLIRLEQAKTQIYELHEYTTPRYFYILPIEDGKRKPLDAIKSLFQSQFKLYFVCECSDDHRQFHTALHEGYVIKKSSEFITTYASDIQTTIRIIRTVLNVGDAILPRLIDAPDIFNLTFIPGLSALDAETANKKLDDLENFLEQVATESPAIPLNTESKTPLQGAKLRELATYLENVDKSKTLGNLHRIVTDDGHVRWVCLEHYDTNGFTNKTLEYINRFKDLGGHYNQENKEAVLDQSTNLKEKEVEILCNLLTKGFKISTLKLEECLITENDLNKLLHIIINRRSINRLIMSTVTIESGLRSKYICNYLSMDINNRSLEIQLSPTCQTGDFKTIIQLWIQNKIHPIFIIRACENFPKYAEYSPTKQYSKAMIVNHVDNIDFLCEILDRKLGLTYLKLNFCSGSKVTLARVCQLLKNNNEIVELDIMNYTEFDNDESIVQILKSLQNHKSLKHLGLLISNIKPSDKKECGLIKFLKGSTIQSRLRLLDSNISHELALSFIDASKKGTLVYLELYNYTMNDEDISSLQSLNCSSVQFNPSNEQYWRVMSKDIRQQFQKEIDLYENLTLQDAIQQQKIDDFIDLNEQDLTDKDIDIVVNNAIKNDQCKRLSLVKNRLTAVSAFILTNVLNYNTTLHTLTLDGNRLLDFGVYALAKSLTLSNQTLKELYLESNGITDKGIQYLVDMLVRNKTLTQLCLSGNEITNQGVKLLAPLFKDNSTTIEKLWLSRNKLVNDLCIDALICMINDSSPLAMLYLQECTFSESNMKKLKKITKVKTEVFF